jgi:hypothetical protein
VPTAHVPGREESVWNGARVPGLLVGVAVMVAALLTSCTASTEASREPNDPNGGPAETGSVERHEEVPGSDCPQSPREGPDQAIRGATKVGTLWALGGEPTVGEQFKIVIRASGTGELTAVAVSRRGTRLLPDTITPHTWSNFQRPGDEWGVFFTFERPGCWRLLVERTGLEGSFAVAVRKRDQT